METKLQFLFCFTIWISVVSSFTTDRDSLVASSTEPTKEEAGDTTHSKKDAVPIVPKIYEMKINTNVSNRFAKTAVVSKVKNLAKTAQEATFSVVLPETAYISGFVMEIDGKSYKAYVKEKGEAKQIYDEAIERGQAAAHVESNARDSNRFTVSVNVEPQKKAIFTLTYEELLQRQNEQYEIVINIHPGQPVKDLNVEVHINETRPLKFVKSPLLRSGNEITKNDDDKLNPRADINITSGTATLKFNPNIERQKQLASGLGTKEENGLAGQFVVQYDVERDPRGGEVLLKDGYFVHFFAPSDIQALPKQVIFVLDTSGSMDGNRIKQLKEAMNSILTELKSEDVFSIVEFGSTVKVWNVDKVEVEYELGEDPWFNRANPETPKTNKTNQVLPPPYEANKENIKKAKKVVEKLSAEGGTDIKSALEVGLKLVKNNRDDKNNTHQPIIVFLTDGEPTVGETHPDKIISAITELNSHALRTPIFSLSFGDGADRDFLQKISLKNLGFARHIYEAADASLQLQEFYKQISSPLLNDVEFKYVSNVTKLTKTQFPIFFHGSELVVAGAIGDEEFSLPQVYGTGITGPIELIPKIETPVGDLERLWAYLTIKQILEARDAADNKTQYTKRALDIALKYSFVSPVSSLVVVKPNGTSAVDTQDASKSPDSPYVLDRHPGLSLFASGDLVDVRLEIPTSQLPAFLEEPVAANPCIPSPCGPNSQCRAITDVPVCSCLPNFVGAPPGCRPECIVNSECKGNTGCVNQKCIDVCPGVCGLNASCEVINHSPICSCPPDFTGDPFVRCNLVSPFKDPVITNPCQRDPAICSCLPNSNGSSPGCNRPECIVSSECGEKTSCVNQKCIDVCPGLCGPNTHCEVINHIPMCTCQPGFTGDPFISCLLIPLASSSTTPSDGDTHEEHTKPDDIELSTMPSLPLTTTYQSSKYEEIKNKLPWLSDILNENGTLTTSLGNYQLATARPECPKTPINGTVGVCTPLAECPQVFPYLTDVQVFHKYFCLLDTYAGICCPTTNASSP